VNLSTAAGQAPKYLIYAFVWDEQGERWLLDSVFEPGTPAPGAEPPPGEGSGA